MAIEKVAGGLWVPYPIPWGGRTPNFSSLLMDASAEKVAFIIQVPKSGTLRAFEFLAGAVAQSPVNGLKVSFQDVDLTTGDPDGTIDQYRVVPHPIGANSWVVPGIISSDGTDTGTQRTVVRGEFLACVIEFSSFVAGDSVNIRCMNLSANAIVGNVPYPTQYTASWAKVEEGVVLALSYGTSDYPAVLGCYPFSAINTYTYNVDTLSADEQGLVFSFPSDVRVGAFYVRTNPSGDASLVLYDKDWSTVLETMSLDKDLKSAPATAQYHFARCPTDRLLYANERYILALKPTTTTDVTLYTVILDSVDLGEAVEGGITWAKIHRLDGGNWLVNDGERPLMGVVISGIEHEISGSSGGLGWEGDP